MSLNKRPFVHFCPLLLDKDLLLLAPGFLLQNFQLVDTVVGAKHRLAPPAHFFIAKLVQGVHYNDLARLANQHSLDESLLRDLLGFLNRIGGLLIKRSWVAHLQALRLRCLHLPMGIRYAPLTYRRNVQKRYVALGVLRATTPVILATGVVASLSMVAGLVSPSIVLCLGLGWLTIFTVSIFAHEQGHIWALKRHSVQIHVVQSGMHLGVIHTRPASKVEIISSLAGPCAGILSCIIAAAIFQESQWITVTALAVAFCHLISLLPFYGDGRSIRNALHERNIKQ